MKTTQLIELFKKQKKINHLIYTNHKVDEFQVFEKDKLAFLVELCGFNR